MSKEYKHFTRFERDLAYEMRANGSSLRVIGQHIGKDKSSVWRELRRNRDPVPGRWRLKNCYQKSADADARAKRRRKRAGERKRLKNREIRSFVIEKLTKEQWSPQQIEDGIAGEHPGCSISARAIYNFIKFERPLLRAHLRLRGKPRRQRVVHRRGKFREGVPPKRSIETRPEEINQRGCVSYEADSILSCQSGSGGILTVIERVSRMRFFFPIVDLKANTVRAVLMQFFLSLPAHLRTSLTVDNGSEFEELYQLERVLGVTVYSCHPYRACERGSVERTNGEFRWYFPKGTDFSKVTFEQIQEVARKLNGRPMRILRKRNALTVWQEFKLAA